MQDESNKIQVPFLPLRDNFFLSIPYLQAKSKEKPHLLFYMVLVAFGNAGDIMVAVILSRLAVSTKKQLLDVVPQLFSQLFMMKNPLLQKGTQSCDGNGEKIP